MRCLVNLLVPVMALLGGVACVAALAQTPAYNLGRTASNEEIRAWDISIGPEGKELPPGSGNAKEGVKIYAQRCALCHGATGSEGTASTEGPSTEGRTNATARPLVGGQGTLNTPKPLRTVGSFWPFATTIWDYISRAMPFDKPSSLSANEVYAVTAYLLYRNGIIQESDVIDAKSLPKIQMPNRNGFVPPQPERWWKPPSGEGSRTP